MMKPMKPYLMRHKKGIEVWISWILLTAMVVILSIFMYQFMVSYTQENAGTTIQTISNHQTCERTGMRIDAACTVDETQDTFNMTLRNTGSQQIDEIRIRFFDNTTDFLNESVIIFNTGNVTFQPQQRKVTSLNISEDLLEDLSIVSIFPVVYVSTPEEEVHAICPNQKAERTEIETC